MSRNASGDTTRPERRPAGLLNNQMPANVSGRVARLQPRTHSSADFKSRKMRPKTPCCGHGFKRSDADRCKCSGHVGVLALGVRPLPPSAAEPSRGLPPSRALTPAPTLFGQSQHPELLLQEMRHQNDRNDQAMRFHLDANQQLLQQLATLSARVNKTEAWRFSTPQIAEPPAPEDDSVSCIPPTRPGSLCRRSTTSGACDFVTDADQLDDGHCPDLARALNRTNEVLGALQREVSDLRTELRAAPKVALARRSVPLGVRYKCLERVLVGPEPTRTSPSSEMVADAIKAGRRSGPPLRTIRGRWATTRVISERS